MSRSSEKMVICITTIISLSILIPIMIVSFYSVWTTDVYPSWLCINGFRRSYSDSFFLGAVFFVKDFYKTYGGYYGSMFWVYLFEGLLESFGLFGLHVVIFLINCCFYITVFFLSVKISEVFLERRAIIVCTVFCVIVFFLNNNYLNDQLYTYYEFSCEYMLVVSFLLILSAFLLDNYKYGKISKVKWGISCICGIICGTAVLNIATLACGILLLFAYEEQRYKRESKFSRCVFVLTFFATLINVGCPANFIRHGDGNYALGSVLLYTFEIVIKRIQFILSSTPTIAMLMILGLVCSICSKNKTVELEWKAIKKLVIYVFLGCFLVVFPVVLGYKKSYLEGRALWVLDLVIYTLLICVTLFLCKKMDGINANYQGMFLAAIVIWVLSFDNLPLQEYTSVKMATELFTGEIKNSYEYQKGIDSEIRCSENDDIDIIRIRYLDGQSSQFIREIGLRDDPHCPVNMDVSRFYKKGNIRLLEQVL